MPFPHLKPLLLEYHAESMQIHPQQCPCLQLQLICQQPLQPSPYCALSVSPVPALCCLHTLSLKSSFLINPHFTPGNLHFTFNNPPQTRRSPNSGPQRIKHFSAFSLQSVHANFEALITLCDNVFVYLFLSFY